MLAVGSVRLVASWARACARAGGGAGAPVEARRGGDGRGTEGGRGWGRAPLASVRFASFGGVWDEDDGARFCVWEWAGLGSVLVV